VTPGGVATEWEKVDVSGKARAKRARIWSAKGREVGGPSYLALTGGEGHGSTKVQRCNNQS
jgi:hypothetical protein